MELVRQRAAQSGGDARKNGVEVRPVDVAYSFAQNTLEERTGAYHAVRLGFRQIDGFKWVDPDEEKLKRDKAKWRALEIEQGALPLPILQPSYRGARSATPESIATAGSKDLGSAPTVRTQGV